MVVSSLAIDVIQNIILCCLIRL